MKSAFCSASLSNICIMNLSTKRRSANLPARARSRPTIGWSRSRHGGRNPLLRQLRFLLAFSLWACRKTEQLSDAAQLLRVQHADCCCCCMLTQAGTGGTSQSSTQPPPCLRRSDQSLPIALICGSRGGHHRDGRLDQWAGVVQTCHPSALSGPSFLFKDPDAAAGWGYSEILCKHILPASIFVKKKWGGEED